jgi:hypothetical protein
MWLHVRDSYWTVKGQPYQLHRSAVLGPDATGKKALDLLPDFEASWVCNPVYSAERAQFC